MPRDNDKRRGAGAPDDSDPRGASKPTVSGTVAPARTQERDATQGERPEGTTTDEDTAPQVSALPSPSLPKGGGAVRGLGETFKVNAANGTFQVTVPLTAPAARGHAPDLTLAYDSGAGNGPFGEGWDLKLGSISRKTDKVLPRYRDEDVFLAGGEDLVLSLAPDGGAWTQGARDAGAHLVQCFRPRVEAAYERVERWTRKSDGDIHWRIRSTDGRSSIFGESAEARIADPRDAKRVFRWLIERSYDDRGNLIRYKYRSEDRANIASTLWEQNRAPANTLPDRILYGVRAPYDPAAAAPDDPAAYLFEIVFDYGERDGIAEGIEPPYLPPATWTARADAFSNFKPGFELRCYRLCKRILAFLRIGDSPLLVCETRLRYDGDPALQKLEGVTGVGWRDGVPLAVPEVELSYTHARVDPTVRKIDLGSAENLPAPVDGKRTQWVDLDGEGLPGALIEDRPGWYYKRNLGGVLAPVEALASRPSLDLAGGGQLLDVAGDGTKSLVLFAGPARGQFARTEELDWAPFRPFRSLPNISFDDSNLRFIDLDGDGRSEVLVTEDEVLRWYPSHGREGFGEAEEVHKPRDEERGPALVFADREQAIYLADMTGDGLTDLVRIRNGQVCYWPNLGYGRFGAKVTMGNAPTFESAYDFQRARVRLADVDGSGTSDLLYCQGDRVRYWLNLAGNRFAGEQSIAGLPYDSEASIDAVDLLGNGTSCLVWSSPLPWHARQPLRYVELTGGIKPHLLRSIDNNLGRSVEVDYASSTKFYVADRAAGRPWATRVPFPVQVVARLSTLDRIGGNRLTADYSYHHGFYDGFEREFRGFGMVEVTDTQALAPLESQGLFPGGAAYVPPVRTRTWFHTGAFLEGKTLLDRFRTDWFSLDGDQARLDAGTLPTGLEPEEMREALRGLRGKPLRTETYAGEDPPIAQTPIPYRVVEHNYRVRVLQPRGTRPHGVFACDPLETLAYHYERNATDPRVEHEVVLRVGPFGAVEQHARVGYPRRSAAGGILASYSENDSRARATEAELYRANVITETRLYEVTGLAAPGLSPFVIARAALRAIPALAGGADDLSFDKTPAGSRLQRRLLRRTQLRYYGDDDVTPLPAGSFGKRALLQLSLRAMLPDAMVGALLPAAVDATALTGAGYLLDDGLWWCPSDAIGYAAVSFFQPSRFTDPFGAVSRVDYDVLQLAPAVITNALSQQTIVAWDYRALQPSRITDVNGNATLARYDALGRLRDTAKTGKNGEGDTVLAPTVHYDYALTDFRDAGTPNHSYVKQRLVHSASGFQESLVYADGFGRELQTKLKANPGPALAVQNGALVTVVTGDRWLASGRTVYDNKGNAVRKYEPYYAVGSAYEVDPLLSFLGVASVHHYDPVGRTVRVDHPDGSFESTVIGAWETRASDGNDNVDEEAKLWATRSGQSAADRRATDATRRHRRTPSRRVCDALGRTTSTFADNTIQPPLVDIPDGAHVLFEERRTLDLEGRPLATFDDRGLHAALPYPTVRQAFDMMGRAVRTISAEGGTTHLLMDCRSKPVYTRDARGFELRTTYDVLRRPTQVQATDTVSATSWIAEHTIYGDDPLLAPLDPPANLLGRVYKSFDQAGIVTTSRYDFKGNPLTQRRQLIVARSGAPDWTAPYLTPFEQRMEYDALDRATRTVLPRRNAMAGSENVIERAWLPHGPLARVTLTAQHGAGPVDVISQLDYDAKGRRVSARYGNGVQRTWTYEPLTFRLASATSTRNGGAETLQQLTYTWDPAGNLTEIADAAQPTVFKNNNRIDPRLGYSYDSIYRLTDATGRELHDPVQPNEGEPALGTWPPDGNDIIDYVEHYDYDSAGNILRMQHTAKHDTQGWTRGYSYDPHSNRLARTSLPGAPDSTVLGGQYGYDLAGNIAAMPHLPAIGWDEHGWHTSATRFDGGSVHHRYASGGVRVRKVQTRAVDASEVPAYERIYLGDYEVYRELDAGGAATVERELLHVFDGDHRVLLVETETSARTAVPVTRYQLDNHLGSAAIELDEAAALLSYEEFFPFGATALHQRKSIAEVSLKRYRFLAKERDEETGFEYCASRYYAAWLGRWISPDSKGIEGGPNLYAYSRNSPVVLSDPAGTDPLTPPPSSSPPPPDPPQPRLPVGMSSVPDPGPWSPSLDLTLGSPVSQQNLGWNQNAYVPRAIQPFVTLEITPSGSLSSPSTSGGRWTGQAGGTAHARFVVNQNTELGVGGSYNRQFNVDNSPVTGPENTGTAFGTLHISETQPNPDTEHYAGSGLFLTGGAGFGAGPSGSTTGYGSVVAARSYGGKDKIGLDVNGSVGFSGFAPVLGLLSRDVVQPQAGANVSIPLNDKTTVNVEGIAGASVGTGGPAPGSTGPRVPYSIRTGVAGGIQFTSGDYGVGIEAGVTLEFGSNVGGVPNGLIFSPFLNIGIGLVNRRPDLSGSTGSFPRNY